MAGQPVEIEDVVVVLPGIMGSELEDAEGRLVWSTRGRALVSAIRTLGRSLSDLRLPEGIGDEHPGDGVRAVGLVPSLHVIPGLWTPIVGYEGLERFLRSDRFKFATGGGVGADEPVSNLLLFPYDWRLSIRYNARLLAKAASDRLERWRVQTNNADAKLVIVAHSLGGMVARQFLDVEGGAELTRALVTIGTPHRGSMVPADILANGIRKGIGPLDDLLTSFARSLPSMYQLLPAYRCMVTEPGRVGLADMPAVPNLDRAMLADAIAFQRRLARPAEGYQLHKVVGIRQPTRTTGRLVGDGIEVISRIDDHDQGGDGTVPRMAAEPDFDHGTEVHEVADQHGHLQRSSSVLDLIDGILTRTQVIYEGAEGDGFGVAMEDVWPAGSRPVLTVPDLADRLLEVSVLDEAGELVGSPMQVDPNGEAVLDPLPPGGYLVRVASPMPNGPAPVVHPLLVWDANVVYE